MSSLNELNGVLGELKCSNGSGVIRQVRCCEAVIGVEEVLLLNGGDHNQIQTEVLKILGDVGGKAISDGIVVDNGGGGYNAWGAILLVRVVKEIELVLGQNNEQNCRILRDTVGWKRLMVVVKILEMESVSDIEFLFGGVGGVVEILGGVVEAKKIMSLRSDCYNEGKHTHMIDKLLEK